VRYAAARGDRYSYDQCENEHRAGNFQVAKRKGALTFTR
jgi:hypothetical protein